MKFEHSLRFGFAAVLAGEFLAAQKPALRGSFISWQRERNHAAKPSLRCQMQRHELLNILLEQINTPRYLEIGVHKGETFHFIKAVERVAVDPDFKFDPNSPEFAHPSARYFSCFSDVYFERHVDVERPFDVVFIDGLHTFEQTFRDFTNALRCTADHAIILLDDIAPSDFVEAAPMELYHKIQPIYAPHTTGWMGDVFKILFMLETFFPFVELRIPAEAPNQLVTWKRCRARSVQSAMKTSIMDVAGLQFADLILGRPHFTPVPLAQIIDEYHNRKSI